MNGRSPNRSGHAENRQHLSLIYRTEAVLSAHPNLPAEVVSLINDYRSNAAEFIDEPNFEDGRSIVISGIPLPPSDLKPSAKAKHDRRQVWKIIDELEADVVVMSSSRLPNSDGDPRLSLVEARLFSSAQQRLILSKAHVFQTDEKKKDLADIRIIPKQRKNQLCSQQYELGTKDHDFDIHKEELGLRGSPGQLPVPIDFSKIDPNAQPKLETLPALADVKINIPNNSTKSDDESPKISDITNKLPKSKNVGQLITNFENMSSPKQQLRQNKYQFPTEQDEIKAKGQECVINKDELSARGDAAQAPVPTDFPNADTVCTNTRPQSEPIHAQIDVETNIANDSPTRYYNANIARKREIIKELENKLFGNSSVKSNTDSNNVISIDKPNIKKAYGLGGASSSAQYFDDTQPFIDPRRHVQMSSSPKMNSKKEPLENVFTRGFLKPSKGPPEPKTYNILLIGSKGAGKTSLINIIACLGLCKDFDASKINSAYFATKQRPNDPAFYIKDELNNPFGTVEPEIYQLNFDGNIYNFMDTPGFVNDGSDFGIHCMILNALSTFKEIHGILMVVDEREKLSRKIFQITQNIKLISKAAVRNLFLIFTKSDAELQNRVEMEHQYWHNWKLNITFCTVDKNTFFICTEAFHMITSNIENASNVEIWKRTRKQVIQLLDCVKELKPYAVNHSVAFLKFRVLEEINNNSDIFKIHENFSNIGDSLKVDTSDDEESYSHLILSDLETALKEQLECAGSSELRKALDAVNADADPKSLMMTLLLALKEEFEFISYFFKIFEIYRNQQDIRFYDESFIEDVKNIFMDEETRQSVSETLDAIRIDYELSLEEESERNIVTDVRAKQCRHLNEFIAVSSALKLPPEISADLFLSFCELLFSLRYCGPKIRELYSNHCDYTNGKIDQVFIAKTG